MVWDWLAAVCAALGGAGIALLLRRASGGRLPRWLVPACAGLALLSYQIYREYTWFAHKLQQLPASAQILHTENQPLLWRPWTFAFPMVNGFSVIDTHALAPTTLNGERVIQYVEYRFEQQALDRVSYQGYLLNCARREQVPLSHNSQTDSPQADSQHLEILPQGHRTLQLLCPQAPAPERF